MKDKIKDFGDLFFGNPYVPVPKKLRLFLVVEDRYLYINNGQVQYAEFAPIDINWKNVPERGDLLDRFAKFEFLINELIRLTITEALSKKSDMLLDIIKNQNIRMKIDFLKKWKLIDSKLAKKLYNLFDVRNGLAHKFDHADVTYNNEILSIHTAWRLFRQDVKESWIGLVNVYRKEEEKIDLVALKEIIRSL